MSAATSTILGFTGFLESGSAKLVDHITWLEVQLNLSASATYSGLKVSITDANKRVSSGDIIDIGFNNSDSFTGPKTFYINKSGVGFSPNINFNFNPTPAVAAWNIQVTVKEGTLTQNVIFNNTRPALPTLSDYFILESETLQSGDDIHFIGLTVNNKPENDPSIQIMFNQEGFQTTDAYAGFQPSMDYVSAGDYTAYANTLPNDRVYRVEARAVWSDIETKPPQLFRNLIVIKRPEIDSVTPLDIQNDGGNDGVGDDSSSQTVLTVRLKGSDAYETYVPSKVVFKLYDGLVKIATTSVYDFQNLAGNASYDIKLNEITREAGVLPLTNGTAYTVKAELQISVPTLITLEDETPTDVAVTRVSEPVAVSFSQNVAPISSVTINNSWLAGGIPDINGGFGDSPLLGISGSFAKTPQFGATYSKNLDAVAAETKFLLEYSVDEGSAWSPVTSCALIQSGDSETETAAYKRAAALTPTESPDGLYANVVGPNSMVFFIPTTLAEGTKVSVRVSIDVARTFWKIDSAPMRGINSTTSDPVATLVPLELVNKIGEYDFTTGEASEPFNSISSSDSILKTEGSVQSSVLKSSVLALTKITTQNDSGWLINKASTKAEVRVYDVPTTGSPPRFKTNQLSGLGVYALIKQAAGALKYPYFNVYTIPKTTPTVFWYTSRLHYELYNPLAKQPPLTPGLPLAADELILLYTGVDVPSLFPGVKRVLLPLDVVVPIGNSVMDAGATTSSNENINSIVLSTSAEALGNYAYTVMETGVQVGAIDTAAAYGINMKFSKLLLNIPVDTQPLNFNSSKVDDVEFLEAVSVIVPVTPIATEDVTYSVKYSIKDPNTDAIVWGLPISKTVPNKYFPVKADFAVTNFTSTTDSSISFDLDILHPAAVDRIDGVNAYITYSGVKTIIGSYTTGAYTVSLASFTDWLDYSTAEISFIAFRDDRVNSIGRQVETASSETGPFTVRKVPVIAPVSGIVLVGGIFGKTTTLRWDAPATGVVVIDNAEQSSSSTDLNIAIAGQPITIAAKVKVNVGGVDYYSASTSISFVSGSVDTTGMNIRPVIDNRFSTDKILRIAYDKETSSGVTIVSRRLMNGVNELMKNSAIVELGDASSYDFDISAILNTLSILVKAHVVYTVDGSSFDSDDVEIAYDGTVKHYVARPSAVGVGIAFAGGFTNADTVITLSSTGTNPLVSYKLGDVDFVEGVASLVVSSLSGPLELEITRVVNDHKSEPDLITFTPATVDSSAATITVISGTLTELYANITDNITDDHEIVGLYADDDTDPLIKSVNDSYPISGTGNFIVLSLQIRAKLQYTLNDGAFLPGDFSPKFVGSQTASYFVSAPPSLNTISAGGDREIRMLTQLNAATPISVVFLVTQEVGNNAKEYLLKFNVDINGVIQSTPDLGLSGVVGSSANGWTFVYADGISVLTAPSGALTSGTTNVLAILSTDRGTDIQVSEIEFA
jgi:hypothetical protein